MILILSSTLALAAPPSSLSSVSALGACGSVPCPKRNPVVAQPSGEILPPDPALEAFIASNLYGGDVGGIAMSTTIASNTIDGYLLVALDADGAADPATWMGFASTTEDWDGDGAADAVVGNLTWESRGQVQVGLAFMSAIDSASSFEPSREIGMTLTMESGGSAVAPFNAWNMETLAIFDMEGNDLMSGLTGFTSVALEMNDFTYQSTLTVGSTSSTVSESAVWTVDGDSLLITAKGNLGTRSSTADLAYTSVVAGAFETETWNADGGSRGFRRSLTSSEVADGSVLTSTSLDTGNARWVRTSEVEVADGTASTRSGFNSAEDLTFTTLSVTSVDSSVWDRIAGGLASD